MRQAQGTLNSQLSPTAPEAYTGLLASSRLVQCAGGAVRLPAAAWQHALAVLHTFPHLTSLLYGEPGTDGAKFVTDSIGSLIERCPHLRICASAARKTKLVPGRRQGGPALAVTDSTEPVLERLELKSVTSAMLQQVAGCCG
jgi:hypothetical protein